MPNGEGPGKATISLTLLQINFYYSFLRSRRWFIELSRLKAGKAKIWFTFHITFCSKKKFLCELTLFKTISFFLSCSAAAAAKNYANNFDTCSAFLSSNGSSNVFRTKKNCFIYGSGAKQNKNKWNNIELCATNCRVNRRSAVLPSEVGFEQEISKGDTEEWGT